MRIGTALLLVGCLGALAPVPVYGLEPRLCADLFGADLSTLNPTAAVKPSDYRLPNDRRWRDYVGLLFTGFSEAKSTLRDGDVVVDLGGGRGRAMSELTSARPIDAIVMNTQEFSDLSHRRKAANGESGELTYRTGWAEDLLPTLDKNSVGAVFDVFGAFHYSVHKDRLIEEIYRVLRRGREARLLFDFENAPAFVGRFRLDHWLQFQNPTVFSTRYFEFNGRTVCVLSIRKPRLAWRELKLNLEIESAELNPRNQIVPRVIYRVRPRG